MFLPFWSPICFVRASLLWRGPRQMEADCLQEQGRILQAKVARPSIPRCKGWSIPNREGFHGGFPFCATPFNATPTWKLPKRPCSWFPDTPWDWHICLLTLRCLKRGVNWGGIDSIGHWACSLHTHTHTHTHTQYMEFHSLSLSQSFGAA